MQKIASTLSDTTIPLGIDTIDKKIIILNHSADTAVRTRLYRTSVFQ